MELILTLMAYLGAFTFLAMGVCIVNSIESKESKKVTRIIITIMIISLLSFLVGFLGLVWSDGIG
jgi:uncharacterized protein with PQ loop repeat